MTQIEIHTLEKENYNRIILHKEGLFWRAYEKSAYAFVTQINPYNATQKFIKVVGENIVSIGFPISAIEKYINNLQVDSSCDKQLIIISEPILKEKFFEWKDSIELKSKIIKSNSNVVHKNSEIEDMIHKFPVENKTPLDCMLFVVQLKRILNGNL